MFDDVLNPKFVHFSRVKHGESLVAHIDRAIEAWGCPCGATASEVTIEYLEPLIGAQTIRIDLWVESVYGSSCTYGFICSSENGNVAYARGERTVVSGDASFHEHNAALLKDLPAYA